MKTLEEQIKELKARILEYERGVQADQILRSIAINSPSNIMVLDMDARIQYINHTVPGITPEQMIGLCLPEIVAEEFRSGIRNALERVARTGEPDRYETSYTSPSGDFSWWDCGVGPVMQDSKVTGYVVVSTNVTEQRRKHEEQERFFNLSVDLMCVAGFDGYFKRVNRSFTTTLGYEEKELLNRPFSDFVHPDDKDATTQAVSRQQGGINIGDFINRYKARDGSYRLLSWRGVADHKNQVIHAVARDITETKNLEEQLQQSRRMEAVGQLAGGIAHDFNNLLAVIQGNIEMALASSKPVKAYLDGAMEATSRAASLTKQLLVFSRHNTLSPTVLNINPLLENLMGLLKRLLPENISISIEQADDVPPILADKSQLEQVIVNLCVNARDAMPEGGKLRLTVEKIIGPVNGVNSIAINHSEYLKLTVADTGCGMNSAIQSRIFEPFFTTKPVGKGSGLGLATVYAIVHQHQGFIEVDSNEGQGATFRIYLPTTDEAESETTGASNAVATIKGGHETILIAEDDPMVRTTVTSMLNQAGYGVLVAKNGLEAVRLFQENAAQVSLVMLDVVMPNLGGLATADQLRQLQPNLKVMFTSGHVQHQQDNKRLETEIFLAKPYQREALLSCVRQILDNK